MFEYSDDVVPKVVSNPNPYSLPGTTCAPDSILVLSCPTTCRELYRMLLLYRRLELFVQKYCTVTRLLLFWCPYMGINVSEQYNGGLLSDIIL